MSKIVDFDGATYSSFSEGREAVRFTAAGCEFISHPDIDSMFGGDYGCRPDFYIQGVIVDYKGAVYQDNLPRLIELSRRVHKNLVITGDMPFNCYTIREYVVSIINTWETVGSCGYHTYNVWGNGIDGGMVVPIFTKAGKVKYLTGVPQDVSEVCRGLRDHFEEEDLDFTLELARYASGFRDFDYEEDWANESTNDYKEQMRRIHTHILHPRNDRLALYPAEDDLNEIIELSDAETKIDDIEDEWDEPADKLEDGEIEIDSVVDPEVEVDPDECVELESDSEPDVEPEWVKWLKEIDVRVGKSHERRRRLITPTVGERLYEIVKHDHDKFMEVITLLLKSDIPPKKMFKRMYVEEVGAVVNDHFGKYDRLRLITKISELNEGNVNKNRYGETLCDMYDHYKKQDRLSDDSRQMDERRFCEVTQSIAQETGLSELDVATVLGNYVANYS